VPKDPKRNIQNYQLRGGHLNEFEFQKRQGELAQESDSAFTDKTDKPKLVQATKRVAEVIAEAHGIVEKRKKRGLVTAGSRKNIAVGKRSAKKLAMKSTKKAATQVGTKKRARASAKGTSKKVATKSATKKTARAGTKTRPSMKTRRQKRASNR
jgi:hypothetical protein